MGKKSREYLPLFSITSTNAHSGKKAPSFRLFRLFPADFPRGYLCACPLLRNIFFARIFGILRAKNAFFAKAYRKNFRVSCAKMPFSLFLPKVSLIYAAHLVRSAEISILHKINLHGGGNIV